MTQKKDSKIKLRTKSKKGPFLGTFFAHFFSLFFYKKSDFKRAGWKRTPKKACFFGVKKCKLFLPFFHTFVFFLSNVRADLIKKIKNPKFRVFFGKKNIKKTCFLSIFLLKNRLLNAPVSQFFRNFSGKKVHLEVLSFSYFVEICLYKRAGFSFFENKKNKNF